MHGDSLIYLFIHYNRRMGHLCMWIGPVCQHGNHLEMGCIGVRFSSFYCEIRYMNETFGQWTGPLPIYLIFNY